MMYRLLLLSLLALLPAAPSWGVNLGFMPGDAYFTAWLSEETQKTFRDDTPALAYGHAIEDMAFCGYAGFHLLKIEDPGGKLAAATRPVIDFVLKKNEEARKKTRYRVFVYNRDVDWAGETTIGLRYNERWDNLPDEALESETREAGFGLHRAERYQTLNKSRGAVAHDKKLAPEIPGLETRIPEGLGWGVPGPAIEEPAVVDASRVQLLLIDAKDIPRCHRPRPNRPVHFVTITVDGVQRWTLTRDKTARRRVATAEAWSPPK